MDVQAAPQDSSEKTYSLRMACFVAFEIVLVAYKTVPTPEKLLLLGVKKRGKLYVMDSQLRQVRTLVDCLYIIAIPSCIGRAL